MQSLYGQLAVCNILEYEKPCSIEIIEYKYTLLLEQAKQSSSGFFLFIRKICLQRE